MIINGIDFDKRLDQLREDLHMRILCRRMAMEFKPIDLSGKDIEYLTDMKSTREAVFAAFGIPTQTNSEQ